MEEEIEVGLEGEGKRGEGVGLKGEGEGFKGEGEGCFALAPRMIAHRYFRCNSFMKRSWEARTRRRRGVPNELGGIRRQTSCKSPGIGLWDRERESQSNADGNDPQE